MKHYSYDEWQQYVNNEMNEDTREELESHLYTCDQCLEDYLQAVGANESTLPVLSNESSFTDLVMAMVFDNDKNLNIVSNVPSVPGIDTDTDSSNETVQKAQAKKRPFYQQAMFHYLLAAAATILLMFSGAFQSVATYANFIENPHIQENKPSVTEGVMNKTIAWMDSLEKKEAIKK